MAHYLYPSRRTSGHGTVAVTENHAKERGHVEQILDFNLFTTVDNCMQILTGYKLTQQIVIHGDWKSVRVVRNRWKKFF